MSELPGNSHRERKADLSIEIEVDEIEEDDRSERVIFEGEVVRREATVGRKLADMVGGVFKELAGDVIVPALKDLARDFVYQGIDRALYRDDERPPVGRRRSASSSSRVNTTVHTPYNQMSRSSSRNERRERDDRGRGRRRRESVNLSEIILKTHVGAEAVIDEMYEVLEKYDAVTIADLNHILGQDELTNPQDNYWGWTELRGLRARKIREGFLLQFPELEDLK